MTDPHTAHAPKNAVLYFDVISPYAFLFHELLQREPLPLSLEYRPVLFAGLLQACGNVGPAEIARKRTFVYQHCTWLGKRHDIPFVMPSTHPFNPLRYLRLILALGGEATVIAKVFRMLYTSGADPDSQEVWLELCSQLNVADAHALIEQPAAKAQLRHNTEQAIADGVFGVPTLLIGEALFWGVDALPMARAFVQDPSMLRSDAMQRTQTVRFGAQRKRA